MRLLTALLLGGGMILIAIATAVAQSGGHPRRMPQLLEDEDLNVGQPLPDVTAYTDSGEPFKLLNLQGQYTVLVFGCLT